MNDWQKESMEVLLEANERLMKECDTIKSALKESQQNDLTSMRYLEDIRKAARWNGDFPFSCIS